MTKGELLANESFKQAPDDSEITVRVEGKDGWGSDADLSGVICRDKWIQLEGVR